MTATVEHPMSRAESLAIANQRKAGRYELRRRVRSGEQDLRDLIADPPPELLRKDPPPGRSYRKSKPVTLHEALTWLPGWGDRRADKMLRALNITRTLPVDDLSPVTRKQVVTLLTVIIDGFRCDNGGCDNRSPWSGRWERLTDNDNHYCSVKCAREDRYGRR